jgi:hypothetical protein
MVTSIGGDSHLTQGIRVKETVKQVVDMIDATARKGDAGVD